ncbi:MAG TPA: coproporphyrinogen-III oxidase family protein [Candidatus Limnocylindrales bacterium]|nr:coproporphyrinogen-III oxidase family protein [Candidatus Limnocylindrales bacterium]
MSQPQPPVALYVHLPFCVARCPYCDFVVYAGADARGPRARTGRLYEAIGRELELRAEVLDATFGAPEMGDRPPLGSVYFGGGTPSLVSGEWLERLIAIVRARFGLAPAAEISLEANPGPDERGDLAAFRRLGVNRVSFGAQSMDSAELRRLGRRHSPGDVVSAVTEARAAGVDSINLDLLYDVPGQSLEKWETTLREALRLAPDHLSLYALTLDDPDAEGLTGGAGDHLPTPPGARRWRERARVEQDDDLAADQYGLASELLGADGWRGYEISNWCRPGRESVHNLVYWERGPYEAVGPGAHAFDGATRRWNAAAMEPYLASLLPRSGSASLPPGGEEQLTAETAAAERVILALRLDRGVPESWGDVPPLAAVRSWAEASGLMERAVVDGQPRLLLTRRGRLLSNELFRRLV